ncbi:MAG: FHA domain-containing protein [Selenomonas sp.]|uniref:FHA domain-containing protein n=1 Tax=Selenomonas sp. TaxID=2053611 RepID=UPI0025ED3721|nr:FHA domain-containing protein [Selenomonas sp.]MCR5758545.1 FHA domain-containing protein [Selenomonas sp.]
MQGAAMAIKVARVVLEYGMLLWLIYFTVSLSRKMFGEVRGEMKRQRKPMVKQNEALLTVLEAQEEELQGRRFAFQEEITIGRGAENDVRIPENFVSHRHATIFLHGAQYVIEDLGSVNHTYVNGQPLEGRAYLKPGDEIRIGMVTLRFER